MTETKPPPVLGRSLPLSAHMIGPIARATEEGKTRAEAAAAADAPLQALTRWLGAGRRLRDSNTDPDSLRSQDWLVCAC
ncbi:hypothetical protein [Streptomyces sp. NPDC005017]|uniref:hypothetical protein n=1 Tax=Streptomyces sp. NPDC005017 TaxID=3364706 RepID=UPI00369E9742